MPVLSMKTSLSFDYITFTIIPFRAKATRGHFFFFSFCNFFLLKKKKRWRKNYLAFNYKVIIKEANTISMMIDSHDNTTPLLSKAIWNYGNKRSTAQTYAIASLCLNLSPKENDWKRVDKFSYQIGKWRGKK